MKDIPQGWVRVADYDERENKNLGGPGGTYAKILAAVNQKQSPIRAYKDGKFWIAMKCDVDAFVLSLDERTEAATSAPDVSAASKDLQYESVCESLADIATSLAGVERLFERLTAAIESIATQPKAEHEPAGAWRDMNGEVMN